MLTNYLKIAVRNLLKQKTYAAINIFGLSVGLACCILIFLFVQHELQHDTFHQNADKIFRLVLEETTQDGSINRNTLFPDFFAKAVAEEFPTIVHASGFIRTWIRVNHQEKSFGEEVGEVDGDFLEMFSFLLLAGDPAKALRQPNNTVISEAVARKFFGDGVTDYSAVLGKILTFHAGGQSQELSLSVFDNPATLMILFGIMLVTGLFAGSYPAVVLSRFQPIQVLKGENRITRRSRLTRLLVVLQYALSIALMIATLVISRQLHFLRTKELGYNQEQVVVVSMPGEQFSERYKTKLAQYNGIISAAASDRSFTSGWQDRSLKTDQGEWQTVRLIRIDPDYLETLGIDLLAGRNFSATHPADNMEAVIVNEAFVKTFGWDAPLDKRLEGLATRERKQPPAIIGVVKDFHIDKLDRKIAPLLLHMNPDNHGLYYVFVRIRPDNIPGTIALLKEAWESVAPNELFNYSFLDENLEAQYRNEERWQKIITCASVFAIAISCLGLLGLASLAVSRRTKEIGVRKVLGASVTNILALLTGDFVKLVVMSNLVAWPAVWFIMRHWLQNFAYRIDLGWWMFGMIGGLALLIAIFTVSAQALRAALANPVKALRYE